MSIRLNLQEQTTDYDKDFLQRFSWYS